MTNHQINKPIFSFVMAPFYLIGDDDLMKTQLLNLNNQTNKSFEVIIPDPHYPKRNWISEFVKKLNYSVVHFPYVSNTMVPKIFDYCIFNNAVLMANSNKIITFQDWRFCHHSIVDLLLQFNQYDFVGFDWQISYKDKSCLNPDQTHRIIDWQIPYKDNSCLNPDPMHRIIDMNLKYSEILYKNGIFPKIKHEISFVKTFLNGSWGHYCINKHLWMLVNGIDEVATNINRYADIDLSARLNEFYKRNKKKIEIPMIKNVMTRIMHNKGGKILESNVTLPYKINDSHKECCFVIPSIMKDKLFVEYVVDKIQKKEFTKLYENKYSKKFIENNKNKLLDVKNSIIGFQCNSCKIIGETYKWYKKCPNSRVKSFIGIGSDKYKLGRNLIAINRCLSNKTFEEKVKILNESWYNEEFLKEKIWKNF